MTAEATTSKQETKNKIEIERMEFEQFIDNPFMLVNHIVTGNEGEYIHPYTAGAWRAWKYLKGVI